MSPDNVTHQNQEKVWQTLYGPRNRDKPRKRPRLKIGDSVRLVKGRRMFKKGYSETHTREIFRLSTVKRTTPVTYGLTDLNGEEIKGSFYEEEIQRVDISP